MRLCVWVSSVLAFTVLILGKKHKNTGIFLLSFSFLFLKMTHWELTFLCTSTTCQPEPSKVFKAPWWENEKPWTSSLLKNLTNQGRHQRMLQIDSLIPLNLHQHVSLPYFTSSKYLHHLKIKLPLQMCWWSCSIWLIWKCQSQIYAPFLVGNWTGFHVNVPQVSIKPEKV